MRGRSRPARAGSALLALVLFAPVAPAEPPPPAGDTPAVDAAPAAGGEPAPALPRNVLSPLLALPVKPPIPVPLSDGRMHLAYELLLVNESEQVVVLDSVAVLDRAGGAVVQTLAGPELEAMLRLAGGRKGVAFEPGVAAYLFFDVSFPKDAALPRSLEHQLSLSLQDAAPAARARAKGKPKGKAKPPPAAKSTPLVVVVAPTEVSTEKYSVVAPPLEGGRWLVANGCCSPIESHRGAMLSIDGALYVPQRFAIDFLRLDGEGRVFVGEKSKLDSYPYFGVPVLSVDYGVVVEARDGFPEQTPGVSPSGIDYENVAGNHVVVELAKGRYALYAHLQTGSVKVKTGDRVQRGQVLGLLGNTGNTDAPHLHFHMMDGPAPLLANGIPYVFTSFEGNGVVTDLEKAIDGEPTPLDATALAGPQRGVLPRDLQLVTFPEPTAP